MTAVIHRAPSEAYDAVGVYLRSIGRHPLLDKEQERFLAQAIEAGNAAAAELAALGDPDDATRRRLEDTIRRGAGAKARFIESNLRLVVVLAQRRQTSGLPLADLIQEGNLGLIRAVEKFDWRTGWKFSTYAKWWIRQAISEAVANCSRTIRLPARVWAQLRELSMASAEFVSAHGRAPANAELAAHMGVSVERVEELLMWSLLPGSLSDSGGGDGGSELGDRLADPHAHLQFDQAGHDGWRAEVERMMGALGERERQVVRLRFGFDGGEGLSLAETGRRLGLTGERVRQIQVAALAKLRAATPGGTGDDVRMSA